MDDPDAVVSTTATETSPVFTDSRSAVFAAAQPLLDRAQRSGDVRADTTLEQVMDMVVGIAKIPSTQPGHIDRILDIALDGLRARNDPTV